MATPIAGSPCWYNEQPILCGGSAVHRAEKAEPRAAGIQGQNQLHNEKKTKNTADRAHLPNLSWTDRVAENELVKGKFRT